MHTSFTVYVLLHIITLAFSFVILLSFCLNLQLQQMKQFLSRLKTTNTFTSTNFVHFRQKVVKTLQWIDDINRLYGRILFAFILSNTPVNTFLIMLFVYWDMTIRQQTVIVFAVSIQALILFSISFFASLMTNRFHKNTKHIIRLYIRSPSLARFKRGVDISMSTRFNLSMSIYISQFHTRNQYTLNLGRYGKLTFALFGRVSCFKNITNVLKNVFFVQQLFYYMKFLVFAFKIVHFLGDSL